ncbi:MAG: FAD:protein FMN transferase [Bacteroidales bacterium]|nr:FAD:protein FMN transferase [Bacteroidales bacterium]
MKKVNIKLLFFLAILSLTTCKNNTELKLVKFEGRALGTYYSISYYEPQGQNYQKSIDSLFLEFNNSLSIYDSNSVISKINSNKDLTTDSWLETVFNKAAIVYDETNGIFDPTVAPLVNAWGFGFTNAEEMTQEIVDSILVFVGFDKIRIENGRIIKHDPRVMLDFNAIAKGYCSDVAASFFEQKGINNYLVEIGGEIASKGQKPDGSTWRVGIEKPAEHSTDEQTVMQVIELKDNGLATSGNYRRYFEENGTRYSHSIDPHSGYPAQNNLLSVSVLANDCMTADAYATAFMVMGYDKILEFVNNHQELDVFIIYVNENNELKTFATKGFNEILE